MPAFVLSIGSNLGNRAQNLRDAVIRLETAMIPDSLQVSGLYETEPIGCPPGSPSFLNAVIAFEADLEPEALLDVMQKVEGDLGRPLEREDNAPRTVDLDILLVEELEIMTDRLTVPHPRMMERAFVLCPLAELHDEFAGPAGNSDRRGVVRLSEPLFSD
jgi:2-amino-4-hydroxy-6-hydroxymethyldihydropteridine diphosphokinase